MAELQGTALDNYGMVIATEELSKLTSIGGSLITLEILARAIENGGTETEAKAIAINSFGQCMSAVAVTEPDFGSDVAGITTTARQLSMETGNSTVLRLVHLCRRADLLMVLTGTNPDISVGHRGFVFCRRERTSHRT